MRSSRQIGSSTKALEIISSSANGNRIKGVDVSLRNINIVTMTYLPCLKRGMAAP